MLWHVELHTPAHSTTEKINSGNQKDQWSASETGEVGPRIQSSVASSPLSRHHLLPVSFVLSKTLATMEENTGTLPFIYHQETCRLLTCEVIISLIHIVVSSNVQNWFSMVQVWCHEWWCYMGTLIQSLHN